MDIYKEVLSDMINKKTGSDISLANRVVKEVGIEENCPADIIRAVKSLNGADTRLLEETLEYMKHGQK